MVEKTVMTDQETSKQIDLREKIIEQMLGAMQSGMDPVTAAVAAMGSAAFAVGVLPQMTEISATFDEDFTGKELESLVVSVEAAVGSRRAGATKLGSAIIRMCEDAIEEDRLKRKQP